jgi:hypothetical protein
MSKHRKSREQSEDAYFEVRLALETIAKRNPGHDVDGIVLELARAYIRPLLRRRWRK